MPDRERLLELAGLVDEWLLAKSSNPGLTCCQAPLLANTTSPLSDRIDLAFGSSAFVLRGAKLVGANPENIAPKCVLALGPRWRIRQTQT